MCLGIQNQRQWQLMPSLLLGITIFLYITTFQSSRSSISNYIVLILRSCTRLVNSILVPSANAGDQLRTTIFSTITKKSDSYTQTLRQTSTTSRTSVNNNQGNATTVKIIRSIFEAIDILQI